MGSEMGDMWRDIHEASKKHRAEKQEWSKELLSQWCEESGVQMKEIAPWHVRLTKEQSILDIYPQRQKWHNVTRNKRGQYRNLIEFVKHHFNSIKS